MFKDVVWFPLCDRSVLLFFWPSALLLLSLPLIKGRRVGRFDAVFVGCWHLELNANSEPPQPTFCPLPDRCMHQDNGKSERK
jgi:hypothetical protein